jgi:hypothetical protein
MILVQETELLHKLFAFVSDAVTSDGGDGGGWIVCSDPKAYADEFEKWQNQNNDTWLKREAAHDRVESFCNDQEYVVFCKSHSDTPQDDKLGFIDTVLVEC